VSNLSTIQISPAALLASDKLTLGGLTSPGKCTIKGLKTPRKIDERDGYGTSGATTVFNGVKCARFSVLFEVVDVTDVIAGRPFFALVKRPPVGIAPLAMQIYHPILAEENIGAVLVVDGGGWDQDDSGLWFRTVEFIEWRKPLPALAAPQAAIPTAPVDTPAPTNPTETAILEVQQLLTKVQAQVNTP
jgi:hypothetical protein